ncbi:MAG: divalent-cation tolerance protein CutA [bacterium]|nr:divalent-cation tolerance protein CutA [bacterium]
MDERKAKYGLITTTFRDRKEASKVMKILLKKRLVSCCQLIPIISSYHWRGKIEHHDEVLLQMKSRKSLYQEIEQEILKLHSYETPQIVMYDIIDGFPHYLDWIEEETR